MPNFDPSKLDFEKTYGDLPERLEKRIAIYRDTRAAMISAVDLAGLYSLHKKYDKALAVLKEISPHKDNPLYALVQVRAASLEMELKKFSDAAADLQSVINNSSDEFLHPSALLKLGICYEQMGNWDQARETYSRVTTEYADTQAGHDARDYLRLLELNPKAKVAQPSMFGHKDG